MLPALLLVAPALAGDPCPIDIVLHEATPAWRDRTADLAALESQRGFVGVSYRGDDPVRVTRVHDGGPAHTAGLRRGDHLLAVDESPVTSQQSAGDLLTAAGDRFVLRVSRDGTDHALTIDKGHADPVVFGILDALSGQDCRDASLDALTDAQREAVATGAFTEQRAFRCDDAHTALAPRFDSGDLVLVRGGRRLLLTMPGWATRCVSVADHDGDRLSPESLRTLVEDLAAAYVGDRHANP